MARPLLAGIVLGGLLTVAPVAALSAQRVVPVRMEPRHRLVLDRPPVGLLDVRIQPGDTSLFHTHAEPVLFVAVSASATDTQPLGGEWRGNPTRRVPSWKPGTVFESLDYATEPVTHRVANVGTGVFHLMGVFNTGAGKDSAAWNEGRAPGPVENSDRWFREWRTTLAPGARNGPLSTPNPVVGFLVSPGRVVARSGQVPLEVLHEVGDWFYHAPGRPYELRNVGREPAEVVVVEVR